MRSPFRQPRMIVSIFAPSFVKYCFGFHEGIAGYSLKVSPNPKAAGDGMRHIGAVFKLSCKIPLIKFAGRLRKIGDRYIKGLYQSYVCYMLDLQAGYRIATCCIAAMVKPE